MEYPKITIQLQFNPPQFLVYISDLDELQVEHQEIGPTLEVLIVQAEVANRNQ